MTKVLMNNQIYNYDGENEIEVKDNATIYLNNVENDVVLNIKMDDYANLLILDFNTKNKSTDINVYQNNNSKVKYIHTFKIDKEYHFSYVSHLSGNNNKNDIKLKGITSGFAYINVDGVSDAKTVGNEINEDIKILNLGGKVLSSPMLHISCKDVIANHNTAISNIREDELFYLNSKGITDMGAINLIQNGYLYGDFKEYQEFYDLIS